MAFGFCVLFVLGEVKEVLNKGMSCFGDIDFVCFFVGFYLGSEVDSIFLDVVGKFFDVYDVCNYWLGVYVDVGFKIGMFFGFLLYF